MSNNLANIVKFGTVDSVDKVNRTARVRFEDDSDESSGQLNILSSSPLITVEITSAEGEWKYQAEYAAFPQGLGLGEAYKKSPPDKITATSPSGDGKAVVTVRPWLPYLGQYVVCIFPSNGDGDGYVIGGI